MTSDHLPAGDAPVSRRALLGGLAGGGLAALIPVADASAATATGTGSGPGKPTTPKTGPANAIHFFADPALNYSALAPLAASAYGASEVGEILTVFNHIHRRGDTYAAYCEEFLRMGRHLHTRARDALRVGRRITARDTFLRASTCLAQALFFVLASDTPTRAREAEVYREMAACFAGAAALFAPAFERVAIPYEGRTLPGWLLTPPGPRIDRPTVVMTNGSDAQDIDLFVSGGKAALERGFNALIYEGPGQGSNLFLHDIPFRYDWEKVITPIVDWLRTRPGVDKRRIMLTGSSFGGYLVPRAAAFERRVAAVVVDPGVTDAFSSWRTSLPAPMLRWLATGDSARFNRFWRAVLPHLPATVRFQIAKREEIYGPGSFYDKMRVARRFVLTRSIASRIDAPTAVCRAQEETFYPGGSTQLMRWLRAHPRRLLEFTIAEGAQFHCEPMTPTLRNDVVLDWLHDNMRPTA